MKCKFCEADMDEGVTTCPGCGKENIQDTECAVETASEVEKSDDIVQIPADDEVLPSITESTEDTPVEAPKKKMPLWQIIIASVASVLLLLALAVVLLIGVDSDIMDKVEDKIKAHAVVATMEGNELTNEMLQIFYSEQLLSFINYNYNYLSMIGLDLEKPLDEQTSYFDENMTWQEYFEDAAVKTWQNYQAVALLAEESGYKLDKESQEALDKLPEDLEKMAKEEGFKNAQELIRDRAGSICTLDAYLEYCRLYYIGAGFTGQTPSDEEIEKYFNDNEEMFAESGITKDSGPIVSVRHILLEPEGTEAEDDTYTQEQWDACLEKAEKLLQEWKNGDATEDSFAELANTYSADSASGGLYTGITSESSFVEPFLNWCIDEERTAGDTGIVKSVYGYHIMYFSEGEPQWKYYATTQCIADRTTELIEEAKEKWTMESNYEKIHLVAIEY